MARSGSHFRQRDGVRALKIARDGGIEPAMLEIICRNGTIFRVHGRSDAAVTAQDDGAKEWAAEIAKLKKGRGNDKVKS